MLEEVMDATMALLLVAGCFVALGGAIALVMLVAKALFLLHGWLF